MIFSTSTGQVYTASLDKLSNINKKIEHGKYIENNRHHFSSFQFVDPSPNSIYDERAYQYLTPSPIPLLHRCRALTTDRTGRSLAALQYHPTTQ